MTKANDVDALDCAEISSPCNVPWDSLLGNERVRHCGACRQNVYNIEALPRREALRLITNGEGRLCVRILRRPDGTIVTSDCWSRLRAARRRGWWALACALVVVGWAQITAMIVGLHGLQSLSLGRTTRADVVLLPTAAPPAVPDEPTVSTMGEMVPAMGLVRRD